jgi:toxin YoeB
LIKEILRNPEALEGLGQPEALKYDLAGCMSREIDEENRIVYTVLDDNVLILRCKGHYR